MSHDLPKALGETPPTQLFRVVVTLANHLRTRMDARLAATGLTTQQAAVATVVSQFERPPTLGAVARVVGTSHQNVRRIVASLESKGLMEVTVDPVDRRARRVTVTPALSDVFGPRDRDDHAAVADWFAVLSDRELERTVTSLARVLQHLTSAPGDDVDPT